MREIRTSGSEGGGGHTGLSLPPIADLQVGRLSRRVAVLAALSPGVAFVGTLLPSIAGRRSARPAAARRRSRHAAGDRLLED
jgi:hypothetical protein